MNIENIAKRLNISLEQATKVKGIINGSINPMEYAESWVNQCYNMPSKVELKLEALNTILEGFGVEYIESVDDSYNEAEGLSYVNLGDTYTATVVFDHSTNTWHYTDYGTLIEESLDQYV